MLEIGRVAGTAHKEERLHGVLLSDGLVRGLVRREEDGVDDRRSLVRCQIRARLAGGVGGRAWGCVLCHSYQCWSGVPGVGVPAGVLDATRGLDGDGRGESRGGMQGGSRGIVRPHLGGFSPCGLGCPAGEMLIDRARRRGATALMWRVGEPRASGGTMAEMDGGIAGGWRRGLRGQALDLVD